jgi:hypothetical protein
VSCEGLAASAGSSPVCLRRVLGLLRRAGLVESRAGAHGGWVLARPPEEISLGDAWRAVKGDAPVLGIHDPRHYAVAIEGADAEPPDPRPRDRFWGEVRLDFSGGRTLPLPSVSPESRILSLRTEPATELSIERDGAGNFFATATRTPPEGELFVAFLTDAPRSYFAAPRTLVSMNTF